MLDAAESGALILTEGDNDTFILSYLREAEGLRPDVEIWDRDLNLHTERIPRPAGARATPQALAAAVDSVVSGGARPIYAVDRYTAERVGGRLLIPLGPLYRFALPGERPAATSFERSHPAGFRAERARKDYMASRFVVSYLMGWIDHYRETGNRSGLADLNARIRQAGGNLRETCFVLGQGALAAGDTAGAIGRFEEALSADPQYHDARRELAQVLRETGSLERAEVEYRALAERSGDPRDMLNFGNVLLLRGRRDESALAYRAAQGAAAGDTLLLSGVVRGFGALGLAADQAGALESLRELAPEDFRGYEALGDAYDLLGRPEDALAAYARAAEQDPASGRVAYKTGVLHLRRGDTEVAEADFRRAVEREPDLPSALNALAYLYAENGDRLEEALRLVDRALEAGEESQSGYYHDTRGTVLAKLGRRTEAEEAFRRALAGTPEGDRAARAETYEHLAAVLEGRGAVVEAREMRAKADSLRAPGA
jgi:tetratricopeptide (TPR) repeat protein